MNTYAIPALKDKRAELAGRIVSLKKQIDGLSADLASLDHTIKLFDPSYTIGSIKPKAPRPPGQHFRQGQLSRLILDTLRKAEGTPLSTKEVASAVMAASGQSEAVRPAIKASVRASLGWRGKAAS